MSRYATKSTTSIYHAYYRKDNVWDYNGSTHKYKESRGTEPLASGEFLHRTLDETKESAALLLVLKLGDTRIISGTVFEDIETTPYNPENETMQEALGNGILDDSEKNRASGVTVQLINAGEHNITKEDAEVEIAKLYDASYPSGSMDAVMTTGSDGRFVFNGVIPGLYYIRFTYSDGSTKMIDAEGNQIDLTSRDYKSTIIDKNGSSDEENLLYNATELSLDEAITHMENWKAKSSIEQNSKDDQKLVEWYKYLDNKKYNVATDDLNLRNAVGEYIYIEAADHSSADIKDKTGTNDITSFSAVYSNSPYFSVSIENDDASLGQFNENIQFEDNTHRPIYNAFNFGLIRVPKTNIKLDKIISNIKLTNTVGTVLEQGDPSKMVNYVSALDKLAKGSKNVKVEMENSMIYGTEIETTYELTVKNISEEDYIEDRSNPRYGDYFKYGDTTNAYLKQLNLQELVDEIDKDYDLHDDTLSQVTYHPERAKEGIEAKDVNELDMKVQYSNELGQNYLSLTKWNSLESGGYSITSYMVEGRFKEDLDLQYDNNVKVVSFQLAEGSTLQSEYQWNRYETTTIAVTPDTGENRNPIYFIVGAIALIALGSGIVLIKKKIIK